jgi:hypothetical protein
MIFAKTAGDGAADVARGAGYDRDGCWHAGSLLNMESVPQKLAVIAIAVGDELLLDTP